MDKQEKLERVTIYLTKREKKDACIAAAHLELNLATLGRRAVQYLIYTPPQEVNNEPLERQITEASVTQGVD